MQAAIGRIQIRKLPEWHTRRTTNAKRISKTLRHFPLIRVPDVPEHINHAFYRLFAFVDPDELADGWTRDRIMGDLNRAGVQCSVGSCPEIYNEKAFSSDPHGQAFPLPVAQKLGESCLAFLVHPTLSNEELEKNCSSIDKILAIAGR